MLRKEPWIQKLVGASHKYEHIYEIRKRNRDQKIKRSNKIDIINTLDRTFLPHYMPQSPAWPFLKTPGVQGSRDREHSHIYVQHEKETQPTQQRKRGKPYLGILTSISSNPLLSNSAFFCFFFLPINSSRSSSTPCFKACSEICCVV